MTEPDPGRRRPAPLSIRILAHMAEEGERFSILGDIDEECRRLTGDGRRKLARAWCWGQVLRSAPAYFRSRVLWRIQMIRNYLKIAGRNILKHKGYSAINLVGLAVGLACCILIFLWVQDAFSYNRYHAQASRLFRVFSEMVFSDGRRAVQSETSFTPLARLLKAQCPGVAESGRLGFRSGLLVRSGDKSFPGNLAGYVDPSVLRMFTFPSVAGDPAAALADKFSCLLTETAARKIFGEADPLGQTLNVNNQYDVRVTGIVRDFPRQSDYRADLLFPYGLFWGPEWTDGDEAERWGGNPLETYVLIRPGVRPAALEKVMTEALTKAVPPSPGLTLRLGLQPLTRVHIEDPEGRGLIRYVPIFSLIALVVLLIAGLNFANLTTARSGNRAREVGLRKVVGARRSDLILQFFGESILMALIALILGLAIAALLVPAFGKLVGTKVTWEISLRGAALWRFAGFALLVGLVAGGYPALFLSAFRPVRVLKGPAGARGPAFRKALVILQFALSIFLIVATAGISRQLRLLRTEDVGFDRDNVLHLTLAGERVNRYDAFKTELLRLPGVQSVTRALEHPAWVNSSVFNADWEGKDPAERLAMHFMYVDYDFFETFGMSMAAGRAFSREFETDPQGAYIVNEAAIKLMGLQNPVGQRLSVFRKPGTIVGVVKDFHFQPLRFAVQPLVVGLDPSWTKRQVFVRIAPAGAAATLRELEAVWKKFFSDFPFTYRPFNARYKYFYAAEERMEKVVGVFTALALFISCLGLFGLASFMAEQRTREVGIRKILGASTSKVAFLLTKEFTVGVVAANLLAWPAAYFAMSRWLQGYASRIILGAPMFILAGGAALAIALLTVGGQSVRASRRNPADALRYE